MMCGSTVRAALSFFPLVPVGGKPHPAFPRALKKSPFFMTKTENAYDL